MTISVSPANKDVDTALRNFLAAVLPSGTEVVRGQANRVPEPKAADFVIFTPTLWRRISTNHDEYVDARFTASIAGTTMTISAVNYGAVKVGSVVFGVGLASPTTITAFGPFSSGGVGTYTVSPSQTVASEVMAAGVLNAVQAVDRAYQLDVHGPNSEDNAHRISTVFRDIYAAPLFQNDGVVPLYADDPRQIPFINGESQFEDRLVVEAHVQVNAAVNDLPQQFFETVVVGLTPVDLKYTP